MLDVGWGDLIDYLGDDPHTQSIVIYMESIGDARAFLSAAREVALTKPIIVIKAGRTEAAAKAAASHTGSLTGSDEVLDAAFRRVRRAARRHASPTCSTWPRCWRKQPRPKGPRLTIVTNAGGPGVLATDALITGGGELAHAVAETIEALERVSAAALEPRQPDRHPRRRRPGALRQGAGDRRQRSEQRRPAGHPHAAGHDRPDRAPPKRCSRYAKIDGQAGAGELDGRRRRGRRVRRS